jgi:hypothetical protein
VIWGFAFTSLHTHSVTYTNRQFRPAAAVLGSPSVRCRVRVCDRCRGRSRASRLHRLAHRVVVPRRTEWKNRTSMSVQGTRIAPRPPRRSRRALLTHRAPPSGQTSAAKGRAHLRSDAPLPLGSTWLLGSASEPRPFVSCFPWVRPFPPRPPLEVAFHCSIASSVL